MANIGWIKLKVEMFDDTKISLIKSMPSGKDIILIWIRLLCMAGKNNDNGLIYLSENIAYTPEMLATIMKEEPSIIRHAMKTLNDFEMIEINNHGLIGVVNWEKHQNVEGLEKIRKQNALRAKKFRAKQKQKLLGNGVEIEDEEDEEIECNVTGNVTVTEDNATEKKREEEEKKRKEKVVVPPSPNFSNSISDEWAEKLNLKIGSRQGINLLNTGWLKLQQDTRTVLTDYLQLMNENNTPIRAQIQLDKLIKNFADNEKKHGGKKLVKFIDEIISNGDGKIYWNRITWGDEKKADKTKATYTPPRKIFKANRDFSYNQKSIVDAIVGNAAKKVTND
jgi:predicted phage replisome organizer